MKKTLLTTFGIATMGLFGGTIASADTVDYTVKSGDTLSHIALENGTTIDRLASDNNLKNIDLIFVGDILTINTDSEPVVTQPVYQEDEVQVDLPDYQTQSETIVEPVQESQPVQQTAPNINSAKEWIARKESGGSYSATNGRYIGRYQLDSSYLNGDYSPENQERVADAYVAGRYGSWENAQAFWLANGWY